jgi:peptidoglycan glycosyltransferase
MNKAIGRIFLIGVILFVALIANVTYLQVVAAGSLRDKPQNHRRIAEELRIRRGRILGFDGSVIADVKQRSGYYYRVYPQGVLAPQVIGYDTVKYGRTGIEDSMNDLLVGSSSKLVTRSWPDRLLGRRPRGADVKLTLVPAVQRAAAQALKGHVGAIVALDPKTGAVIASASAPDFSPARVEADWATLNRAGSGAPLLNRVTQGLYPPGSSFKVVTAAAGLDTGKVTPRTPFTDTGTYVVNGGKVVNYHGEIFGNVDFTYALTMSINTVFGQVGDMLGRATLIDYMQRFGFWSTPTLELPAGEVSRSARYGSHGILATDGPMDPLAVAWAAVGQEQVLATPLQMALVAAAVANGGRIMKPYLVDVVLAPGGGVVERTTPGAWRTVIAAQTATTLNTMMQQVVNAGTGTAAALQGIKVAGKTGTAQKGASTNEAWFIGFAPADAPRIAVAVLVENTPSTGGEIAAPMAAQVMKTALALPALP